MKKTWGEIKNEAARLGFEKTSISANAEYKGLFIDAANEAQMTIAKTVKPIEKTMRVAQMTAESKIPTEERIFDGKDIVYRANARAYYFEVYGKGKCDIVDVSGTRTVTFDEKKWTAYKDFCSGNVMMRFYGEFLFSVRNAALYERVGGSSISDIPDNRAYTSHDLLQIDPLYMEIYSVRINNSPAEDWYCDGSNLLLPSNYPAEYIVTYHAYPTKITEDTPDSSEIELDYDAANLMPRRMAYTIWLDDDIQKAIIYNNEYTSMAEAVIAKERSPMARVHKGVDI